MTSSFVVTRRDLRQRADVSFAVGDMAMAARYRDPVYPLVELESIASVVQYGCSVRATAEVQGVPIIRMNNLRDDGLDLSDLKYVDLSNPELERYLLQNGDLLFNRTNSKELVGKCAVYREEGAYVFASYLIRVRVDLGRVLPEYVSYFLNSSAGRVQIDRVSRRILGMSNVNSDEVKSLIIPLPSLDEQISLSDTLIDASARRMELLRSAQQGLLNFSEEVQRISGVPVRNVRARISHSVSRAELASSGRLDANYHHPERKAALTSLEEHAQDTRVLPLGQVVDLVHEPTVVGEGEPYLGLASVESHTGRLVNEGIGEAAEAALRFKRGDVLYCRLRPYLNKVWTADRDGLCSTEFRILRMRPDAAIEEPDFLAAALRTPAACAQATYAAAGNTHPRISDKDLLKILVFAPPLSLQRSVLAFQSQRREEALHQRVSAESLWSDAKIRFELAVLPVPE
jgi:type I restriction enzyme S subunit